MKANPSCLRLCGAALLVLSAGASIAQTAPPAAPVAERVAKRFPQPVRVGDLLGRALLQPDEAQAVLGRVQALARRPDGGIDMIVRAGTILGFGGRPVAVPVEAVALLANTSPCWITRRPSSRRCRRPRRVRHWHRPTSSGSGSSSRATEASSLRSRTPPASGCRA